MRNEIGRRYDRSGQQLDIGDDLLIARDRAADYGRLNHHRMLVQYCLDLGRIDIEAGADDQLLGAADDVKNVIFEAGEIASIEPAIGVNHRRGPLGGPIIAAHDIGTADVQFADLARSDGATARPTQTRLDPSD